MVTEFMPECIILSHPTGNANVRAAANGLMNAGLLQTFNTTIATFTGDWSSQLANALGFKQLRRREYRASLKSKTSCYPLIELGRLMVSQFGLPSFTKHEGGVFSVDRVYQALDKNVAKALRKAKKRGATAVYSYEDGALQSFNKAKEIGLYCYYDLPIGYWRAKRELLMEAKKNHPEWAATMSGFRDSDAKLMHKDQELARADHIFVASSFTAQTLEKYPGTLGPVHVIPYGFPDVAKNRTFAPLNNRKLKVLFVGGLSERKGIAELFEAVNDLKDHISLTVVGKKRDEDCKPLNRNLMGRRYISSLPHNEILDLMRRHDLLLFPSLFEGFGLVITEAMSQGTPVITTNRTAGPDLITHGHDGWIIEAASAAAIVWQLETILAQPGQLKIVGQAAMQTARRRPWKTYGRELAGTINAIGMNR